MGNTGMRRNKRRVPVAHSPQKKGTQCTLVTYQKSKESTMLGIVNLTILSDVRSKDTSHAFSCNVAAEYSDFATFFNKVWSIKRGSANTLPEISALLFLHRDSETSTVFRIDNSTILPYDISAEDILHTIFLHSRSHNNTSFLHIASHYFPMAGLSHLTRVQLKTRSCWTPGLFFSFVEEYSRRWSVAERRVINPSQMHCKGTTNQTKLLFPITQIRNIDSFVNRYLVN